MNVRTFVIFDTIPARDVRAKMKQMLDTLSGIALFEGFSRRQLKLLLPLFEDFSCADNTVVFEQGDKAVFFYLILRGSALIQYKPYDSPPITISRVRAGDVFGWSAIIGTPTYSSSIRTASRLDAVRMRGDAFLQLCREHPRTGATLLNRLANGVSGRWKDASLQAKSVMGSGIEQSAGMSPSKG